MGLFWGIFGPQNVRAVLNRAIFNHWVSNLDCGHDFKIHLHLQKRKHQFWAICAAFGVMPLFRVNFFPQFSFYLNSFYPNFFFTQFFFTQIFVLPKKIFSNFFWDIFFFLTKFFLPFFLFFSAFNNISQVICMLHVATRTVENF